MELVVIVLFYPDLNGTTAIVVFVDLNVGIEEF